MSLEKRLAAVEDRLVYLQAIVDGGEMQMREANAYVISLVVQHLHNIGAIDAQDLRAHLETYEGDASDTEDYMGDHVRFLADMVDFHRQHPDAPPAMACGSEGLDA